MNATPTQTPRTQTDRKERHAAGDQLAQAPVTFVGTLPPPVSGMTVMTKVIVDRLQADGGVRVLDWSPGRPMKGLRWRVARGYGFVRSLLTVLLGRRRQDEVIYTPASSRWGQLYDLALAVAARLRGYRLVVHHHVYSYIDRRDWRMALLNRLIGKRGGHVVHCDAMAADFRAQYATSAEFLFVPPTIVSQHEGSAGLVTATESDGSVPTGSPTNAAPTNGLGGTITLGLLSNLKLEKGLDVAIAAFETLSQHADARLILAGPCMGAAETAIVQQTVGKWPERVRYLGPVGGQEKADFYRDIDVFVFPTRYPNESWGIVLTEALAAGKPVIAHDRGCIRHIVAGECGLVVPRNAEFVEPAVKQLRNWIDDPAAYIAACDAAIEHTVELERQADDEFNDFLTRIRTPYSRRTVSQQG